MNSHTDELIEDVGLVRYENASLLAVLDFYILKTVMIRATSNTDGLLVIGPVNDKSVPDFVLGSRLG